MKRTKSWLRTCVSVAGIAAITLSASNAYAEEAPEFAHLVQAMRKTVQTSQYIQTLGPFFVGHALWQSALRA